MRTNIKPPNTEKTAEGAPAARLSVVQQLRRSVMACMLWENSFYEDGESIGDRIQTLADQLTAQEVADIAIEARTKFKLRHAPLWLGVALAKRGGRIVGQTIEAIIQRADELAEFLALYWRDGKKPLAKQVKIGLARAFLKFDAYQLAKYNRDNAIRLRDVLFMVHAKPRDEAQAETWKQLASDTLPAPDTWEVALSAGADKRSTFTRLLAEKKLGYMALLKNLRNMEQAGVDRTLIEVALLEGAATSKALPFRFISAVRGAPAFAQLLDAALLASLNTMQRLPGKTLLVIDVSQSMESKVSGKSDMSRMDAAAALGALVMGIADARVFTFSYKLVEVPAWRGLALCDGIIQSQEHGGTFLGNAIRGVVEHVKDFDRLIVITDEQSRDEVQAPKGKKNYMVNVACERNGVGYSDWIRIDGFSESIVEYIRQSETVD